MTRKCPRSGHCLAPPERPGTRGTPRVNLGGQPQGSEGDFKAIQAKKKFCDIRTHACTDIWTDRRDRWNSDLDLDMINSNCNWRHCVEIAYFSNIDVCTHACVSVLVSWEGPQNLPSCMVTRWLLLSWKVDWGPHWRSRNTAKGESIQFLNFFDFVNLLQFNV